MPATLNKKLRTSLLVCAAEAALILAVIVLAA